LAHVVPGTTIYSDTWRPYFTLAEHGFDHHMVNHSEEFVTAQGGHTQEIESLWNQIKADLKVRRGYNANQLGGVLDEFMFRHEYHNNDIFPKLLEEIAIQYPLN
jgi:hypothetical protein